MTQCSSNGGARQDSAQKPPDSALFAAVRAGEAGTLSSLLARGGNPNAIGDPASTTCGGCALLHEASKAGDSNLVDALLSAKADPNLRDKDGMTPLHLAAAETVSGVITITPQASSGTPVLAMEGRMTGTAERERIVQLLVQHGADPNARSSSGTTPLMEAGSSGGIVRALVKYGADVNTKANDGETALHMAMMMYSFSATGLETIGGDAAAPLKGIEALVECGAAINALDSKGRTPLDLAMPVIIPGLIEPPPGGVNNVPSVKYLRSKGGKTARELKNSGK
jgi:ankyrin repeat protein